MPGNLGEHLAAAREKTRLVPSYGQFLAQADVCWVELLPGHSSTSRVIFGETASELSPTAPGAAGPRSRNGEKGTTGASGMEEKG